MSSREAEWRDASERASKCRPLRALSPAADGSPSLPLSSGPAVLLSFSLATLQRSLSGSLPVLLCAVWLPCPAPPCDTYSARLALTPVLRSNPNYFPAHTGLVAKLRNEFAASIAASFRRVRLAQLSRWLDIKAADLPAWCKEAQWEIDGDVAVVPENGDNNVKAGVVKENVQLKRESTRTGRADRQSLPSLLRPRRFRVAWRGRRRRLAWYMHWCMTIDKGVLASASERCDCEGTIKLKQPEEEDTQTGYGVEHGHRDKRR